MGTPLIVFAKQADNVIHILRANGEEQKNAASARGHLTAALFFLLSYGTTTRREMYRW